MPARSEKQRRFLNAKFGNPWVKAHHFDKVVKKRKPAKKKARRKRRS